MGQGSVWINSGSCDPQITVFKDTEFQSSGLDTVLNPTLQRETKDCEQVNSPLWASPFFCSKGWTSRCLKISPSSATHGPSLWHWPTNHHGCHLPGRGSVLDTPHSSGLRPVFKAQRGNSPIRVAPRIGGRVGARTPGLLSPEAAFVTAGLSPHPVPLPPTLSQYRFLPFLSFPVPPLFCLCRPHQAASKEPSLY